MVPQSDDGNPEKSITKKREANASRFDIYLLDQLLLVDHQLELQAQLFGSLTAQQHTAHEDLKIIHHRAKPGAARSSLIMGWFPCAAAVLGSPNAQGKPAQHMKVAIS